MLTPSPLRWPWDDLGDDMAIPARIISEGVAPDGARRAAARFPVDLDATLRAPPGQPHDALIEELSRTGCLVTSSHPLTIGERLSIGFAGIGLQPAEVVRQQDTRFGCAFVTPLTDDMLDRARRSAGTAPTTLPVTPLPSPTTESPEPVVERFSPFTRILIAVGGATLAWGGVAAAVIALG